MAFHNEACAGFKRSGTWPSSPPLAHNANGKLIRGSSETPKPNPSEKKQPQRAAFFHAAAEGCPSLFSKISENPVRKRPSQPFYL